MYDRLQLCWNVELCTWLSFIVSYLIPVKVMGYNLQLFMYYEQTHHRSYIFIIIWPLIPSFLADELFIDECQITLSCQERERHSQG